MVNRNFYTTQKSSISILLRNLLLFFSQWWIKEFLKITKPFLLYYNNFSKTRPKFFWYSTRKSKQKSLWRTEIQDFCVVQKLLDARWLQLISPKFQTWWKLFYNLWNGKKIDFLYFLSQVSSQSSETFFFQFEALKRSVMTFILPCNFKKVLFLTRFIILTIRKKNYCSLYIKFSKWHYLYLQTSILNLKWNLTESLTRTLKTLTIEFSTNC